MMEQRSLDWFRARLGHFTGSRISAIIGKGRGKEFTDTGLKYIDHIVAERLLDEAMVHDDLQFAEYIEVTNPTSRAMRWGSEQEANAISVYSFSSGHAVTATTLTAHPDILNYAASPDGITDAGEIVEVKCPMPETSVSYIRQLGLTDHDADIDGAAFKKAKPEYYWQMIAEMDCTGLERGKFIVYNAWCRIPLVYGTLAIDEDDVKLLHERLAIAEEFIHSNYQLLKND